MSVTTSYSMLAPADAAFMAIPPGTQYPAEINMFDERNHNTTKHAMNATVRETQFFDAAKYPLEQVMHVSGGLYCDNANSLGGRPNLNPSAYSASCGYKRFPEKESGHFNAQFISARQGLDRFMERMQNYAMGDIDVSTSLLGSPPPAVQRAAVQGSTLNRDGATYISMTALNNLNYPETTYSTFYSPLPPSTVGLGSCVAQQARTNSLCNNGQ